MLLVLPLRADGVLLCLLLEVSFLTGHLFPWHDLVCVRSGQLTPPFDAGLSTLLANKTQINTSGVSFYWCNLDLEDLPRPQLELQLLQADQSETWQSYTRKGKFVHSKFAVIYNHV